MIVLAVLLVLSIIAVLFYVGVCAKGASKNDFWSDDWFI